MSSVSAFQDLFQEVAAPALFETLGETLGVTQWPLGVASNAVTVEDAIWNEDDSADIETRGKEGKRFGTLIVPDATSVDDTDVWVIRSEQWSATNWDRDQGGNKRVRVTRTEIERRQSGGRIQGGPR